MKQKIKKIIKKLVLRALALALLLIPVCAMSLLTSFIVPMVFIFISFPIPLAHVQQIVFVAVAVILFTVYAPSVCHWADQYV